VENRFDALTKAVAEGIPRRQALRQLGSLFGLFGGAMLASLALGSRARAGQGPCLLGWHWCSKTFNCVQHPSDCK